MIDDRIVDESVGRFGGPEQQVGHPLGGMAVVHRLADSQSSADRQR